MISIIIPAHNAEESIEKCLDSVLHVFEKPNSVEVLVVANGCTDRTESLVTEYQNQYSASIRLIKITTPGRSHARNVGLSKAKGKYISFLDADDLFCYFNWQNAVNTFEKHHDVFAVWNDTLVKNNRGESVAPSVDFQIQDLENRNIFFISSIMFRNTNIHPFDEDLFIYEDWIFWVKNISNRRVWNAHDVSSIVWHGENNTTAKSAKLVLAYQIVARSRVRKYFANAKFITNLKDAKKLILFFCLSESSQFSDEVELAFPFLFRFTSYVTKLPILNKLCLMLSERELQQHLKQYE